MASATMPVASLPVWIPLLLVVVRIRRVWVPIPVFLLWPLLLLAWLLAALAVTLVGRRHASRPWLALWLLWCLFGAARGLRIDVRPASTPRPAGQSHSPIGQNRIYVRVY